MDIRAQTRIIIRKGNEFLVGTICYSTDLRWSVSVYDAWQTRNRKAAKAVAEKVGGERWLFNPIAGQLRKMKEETAKAEIEGGEHTWWFVCSECHGAIDPHAERCEGCGRRIIW